MAKKSSGKRTKAKRRSGGFGGSPTPRPAAARPVAAPPAEPDEAERESHMAIVRDAVAASAPKLLEQLGERGYAIVDDFLPPPTVRAMRAEAASLHASGRMAPSQSTRWDAASGEVERYEKANVYSASLEGGGEYRRAPRLTEYCVVLVRSLPPLVNARFPPARLSAALHTNKLAVCLGDGSTYAKHYDNSGGGDLRKLTVLVYLNTQWKEAMGGQFQMFADGGGGASVDIAPLGGRLLAFWSDSMVHGVRPSFAPGEEGHRWALTVWLHSENAAAIEFDAEAEARHFPEAQGPLQAEGRPAHRALAG